MVDPCFVTEIPEKLTEESRIFFDNISELTDFICLKVNQVPYLPVSPYNLHSGDLMNEIPIRPPEFPEPFVDTITDFNNHLLPKILHWLHPKFFAYFPGGNAFPNIIGDMLSTTCGGVGFSWAVQPTIAELENLMMDWMVEALDLPEFFHFGKSNGVGGGFIQNSASDSIHNSILAARHRALEKWNYYEFATNELSRNPDRHPGTGLVKLVAYVNKQAHSSVHKGANLALCRIRLLEPDCYDSINGQILQDKILEDIKLGLTPFYCCASLGTTGACAFDDLQSIGPICQKYNMWLHIDAAYGGNSFILPEFHYLKYGIEYADSFEVNPYKFLLGTIDCSCMFVKYRELYSKVFTVEPTFPEHLMSDEVNQSTDTDYRNFGIPTTRRMRALKLWCLFRLYGIKKLQDYIRRTVEHAKHFESLVMENRRFEVCNKVILGLVCFRQKPNTKSLRGGGEEVNDYTDCQNQKLMAICNESGAVHLVPTTMQGKYVLRFSVNYEYTTTSMIDNAWKVISANYVTTTTCKFDPQKRSGEDFINPKHAHILPIPEEEYKRRLADPNAMQMSFGPVIVPINRHLAKMLGVEYVPAANKLALDEEKIAKESKDSTVNHSNLNFSEGEFSDESFYSSDSSDQSELEEETSLSTSTNSEDY